MRRPGRTKTRLSACQSKTPGDFDRGGFGIELHGTGTSANSRPTHAISSTAAASSNQRRCGATHARRVSHPRHADCAGAPAAMISRTPAMISSPGRAAFCRSGATVTLPARWATSMRAAAGCTRDLGLAERQHITIGQRRRRAARLPLSSTRASPATAAPATAGRLALDRTQAAGGARQRQRPRLRRRPQRQRRRPLAERLDDATGVVMATMRIRCAPCTARTALRRAVLEEGSVRSARRGSPRGDR